MISARLVQLVEDHSDKLTDRIVRDLRSDPRLEKLSRLPDAELRARCQEILRRLGHWLTASQEAEIAAHFEAIGRERRRQGIPLQEVVAGLQVFKNRILSHVRDQGLDLTSVELYAEEELEHQVGVFFDSVIYHVVRGWENAQASSEAAVAARS